jgi:hypothetical protein
MGIICSVRTTIATKILTVKSLPVKSLPVKSLRFPNPHPLRYWVPVS